MKLALAILAALAVSTVEAGFCDRAFTSGYLCDGDESKYCSCKTKKGKRKCDKTQERQCWYNCGSDGRCNLPPTPAPADEVCSTVTLPKTFKANVTDYNFDPPVTNATTTIGAYCPTITESGYKTWQDVTDNVGLAVIEPRFELTIEDVEWWDALRIRMFTNESSNNSVSLSTLPTEMKDAWNCSVPAKEFSCERTFPQCKDDAGFNDDCITTCEKMDSCVAAMETACASLKTAGLAADPMQNITCTTYADMYGEFLVDGKRKCKAFCEEFQNDMSDASSIPYMQGLLVSLFAGFFFAQ